MDFNLTVKLKNFGKIEEAEIELNRMTIFAGFNNTGKSYVSKFLYSFLDALNLELGPTYLGGLTNELIQKSRSLRVMPFQIINPNDVDNSVNVKLSKAIEYTWEVPQQAQVIKQEVCTLLRHTSGNKLLYALDEIIEQQVNPMELSISEVERSILEVQSNLVNDTSATIQEDEKNRYLNSLDNLTKSLTEFKDILSRIIDYKTIDDNEEGIKRTYAAALTNNLQHNFQVPQLSQLIGKDVGSEARIEISAPFNDKYKVTCAILPDDTLILDYNSKYPLLDLLREHFSRVIYLESSLYWKLESPLIRAANNTSTRFRGDDDTQVLSGIPKYFNDLVESMSLIRTGKPGISLDIKTTIGGKIIRENSKQLLFQENDSNKKYTLPMTATGVIQLGFLEHLVNTQVIKEDSVVFFDEPEAHLHPKWQKAMIKSLFNLTQQGVNVVFSSHSPDNIQWLKSEMREKPETEEIVSMNHFKVSGNISPKANKTIACDYILTELTESFAEEYYRSL